MKQLLFIIVLIQAFILSARVTQADSKIEKSIEELRKLRNCLSS